MNLQLLKENPLVIGVVLILVVGSGGLGFFLGMSPPSTEDPTPTPTPEQQPQTLDDIEFNSTELLASHQETVQSHSLHKTTFAVYRNNETAYVQETTASDTQLLSFTRHSSGKTTELWAQSNPSQTLIYNYETENVTESRTADFEDRRTQDVSLQYLLNSGEFKYTNVSITGESNFRLTNLTDEEQFKLAIPAVSHRTNATLSNVSVNGTFENGHITHLEGTFEYTTESGPQRNAAGNVTNNTTTTNTIDYKFVISVDTNGDNITLQEPSWVSEYETQSSEANETETNTSTETNSSEN